MTKHHQKIHDLLLSMNWKPTKATHVNFYIYTKGKIIFFSHKLFGINEVVTVETIKRLAYIENISQEALIKKLEVQYGK